MEIIAEEKAELAERELMMNLLLGFQVYQLSPYKEKPIMNFKQYSNCYSRPKSDGSSKLTSKKEEIAKAHEELRKMGFGDLIK